MKTIKIILGVIIGLSIIFFATGLVVKETEYEASITVNKPIKEVFYSFSDMDKMKEWLPEVKVIEPINETTEKIGNTYRIIIENQKQEKIPMTQKIVAYIPNSKITFRFMSDTMLKTDDYHFVELDNQTKIVQHSTISSDAFIIACTFPWFKRTFKKKSQEYLNQFKQFIEK